MGRMEMECTNERRGKWNKNEGI